MTPTERNQPTLYATAPAYAPHAHAAIDKMLTDCQALAEHARHRLVVSDLLKQTAPRGTWWLAAQRQPDFETALQHDLIACYRGGYGCTHLIETVLQAAEPDHAPKLIGFSDITVLHACFHRRGWRNNLYGPIRDASKHPRWAQSVADWLTNQGFAVEATPVDGTNTPSRSSADNASGTLFAVCASVLAGLCGTPAQPNLSGHVLALEDIDERPYRWDRYLTQLHLSGTLDGVQALLIGSERYERPSKSGEPTLTALLQDWQTKLGIPILRGLAFGHIDDPIAMPQGWACTLDTQHGGVQLTPPATRA